MDFTLTEEQEAVRQAATSVFTGSVTPDRVLSTELGDARVDRELWAALAAADLLGLAVPEDLGGGGLGLTELCLVLEAQGRCVAPVPLWSTLVLGALPIARFGTPVQRRRWLPSVASGEVMLTAALSGAGRGPRSPTGVRAERTGAGWCLTGTVLAVPQAHLAARVLVPAEVDGAVVVVLVDPGAPGVRLERAVTTNREIHPHLHLEGAVAADEDVLAGPDGGRPALDWVLGAAGTGLCALQVGVCEAALAQTAAYLNERQQFGRPLSTFQGTMLRAADAAIDLEAMRVTLWQAAWRIDTDRPAAEAVSVAKWQASERGQGIVHATLHLHGGVGADITYPIHRYFFWGKQIEMMLGSPSSHLARLGELIAARATSAEVATGSVP